MKNLSLFVIVLLISLCIGCATVKPVASKPPTFTVYVDSLSSKTNPSYKTYILLPANKGILPNDLQFQEFSRYVEKALTSQGFSRTEDIEEAELVVFLGYGIGEPQKSMFEYSIPVTDMTYNNFGSTTAYIPTYSISGRVSSSTRYFRYVLVTAFDLNEWRKSQKEVQVWRTTITSRGSSNDLRRVFPVLVGASKNYLATDTGKRVKVILEESDKRVLGIKSVDEK